MGSPRSAWAMKFGTTRPSLRRMRGPWVGHRERLGEALRLVVDAAWPDRVDVAPVVLALGVHERIPVDLRGGREEKARALLLREPERLVGAERAHLERRDRQLEVVDRARGRGEVQDGVER